MSDAAKQPDYPFPYRFFLSFLAGCGLWVAVSVSSDEPLTFGKGFLAFTTPILVTYFAWGRPTIL